MRAIQREVLSKPEVKSVYHTEAYCDLQKRNIELPTKLIGDLIYKSEVSLIYAYKGRGKSIFSWQISLAVAKGENLDLGNGIILENNCDPMTVLYFDYELKDPQVMSRLGNLNIPNNLIRKTLLRGESAGDNAKDVFNNIKNEAVISNSKFIVIDNISKISTIDETNGQHMKEFLKPLMDLAQYDGYTILVVGHTTKAGGDMKPIREADLFGSSKIPNEVDAMIGIGQVNNDESQEYYIKQLKTRVAEIVYNSNNVIKVRIEKNSFEVPLYVSDGLFKETDLLINVSVNTEKAPNREFFTYAQIYYGSSRKAEYSLKEIGIETNHATINNNYNVFKEQFKDEFERVSKLESDALKNLLESKSPNQDECLSLRNGHVLKDDNDNFF